MDRLLEQIDPRLVDDTASHPEETRAFAGETERAAGEECRVSDPSGDARGFVERLARAAPVRGLPLRVAAREEDLTALSIVVRAHVTERVDGVREVRRRRLVAERSG